MGENPKGKSAATRRPAAGPAGGGKGQRCPLSRPQIHAEVGIPVVAIGASAGGLDPIGRLLAAMPADSGLAFVVLDPALKVVSSNAAFAAAFGLTTENIQGKDLRALRHAVLGQPKLHELLARLLEQQAATGAIELEVEQPAGGCQVWQANARRFRAAAAEQPLILLALNDVTDQRRIVERQLQMMVDFLPEAVLAVDAQRRIRFVGHRVERLFGYRRDELIGRPIDMLVPAALREGHAELFAGFMSQPTVRQMGSGVQTKGVTKDGRQIPLDIGLNPVPTAEGLVVLVAIHDLRPQKQAEIKLREAMAAANRANLAKSRFLGAASHDLRQPLQTFHLLLGVLEKRWAGDRDSQEIISKLEAAVAGMTELLDTFLEINQIESGEFKPQIRDFPVGPLLAHQRDVFAQLAAAKGLALRTVPSSMVVRSDPRVLERMVGNLVSNAIKYTDRGKLLLGCRRRGDKLRIEVWDTGIGIPEDKIETVFDEFYRLNPADSARFGLGLGLYIVRRFALLLDHAVEVRSRPGKGTMFAVVAAAGNPTAPPKAAGRESIAAHAQPPTILLLEDDPNQLDSLRLLLEMDGYRVMPARQSAEALSLVLGAAGHRPDAMVADLNLPDGMTGLQVIERVRRDLAEQIPALIVSGDKSAAALRAFAASDQAFITKPVRAAELLATLGALVDTVKPGWLRRRPQISTMIAPAPAPAEATVCVIDDDHGVREAIRAVLAGEGHGVTVHPSCAAFLADKDRHKYRCLVVDVGLPGMDGLALQNRLKTEQPDVPIIFVTGSSDLPKAVRALRNGAADFLQKPFRNRELCASVARVLERGKHDVKDRDERIEIDTLRATLTHRERQVMDRVVAGKPNKIIAEELAISQRTVEHHRQSVMRKMGTKSLATLVRLVGLRNPPG